MKLTLLLPAIGMIVAACKNSCAKLVDSLCEVDRVQCEMLRDSTKRIPLAREHECEMQLEELERLPLPRTSAQFSQAADRVSWRMSWHPKPRVAGLPAGYVAHDWLLQVGFSSVLEGTFEPPLPEISGESVRFAWLPSLSHGAAFVARASANDAGASLEWKRVDQPGETPYFTAVHLGASTRRALTSSEWLTVRGKAVAARQLPARTDRAGSDGSEWLLESSLDGGYGMALRWVPDDSVDAEFRDVCLTLLILLSADAGADVE